jgi:flagellar basal body-associated protein FliL
MEVLRDIRTLEEIPDVSLYLFIIMIAFALLVIAGIGGMLYRHFKSKSEDLTKKEVLKRLHEVDLNHSKEAAYKITKYARYLATEERAKKILAELELKLTPYKYVKNPPPLDDETINHYHLFLEVLDG